MTDERNCGTCQHWDRPFLSPRRDGLCREITNGSVDAVVASRDAGAELRTVSLFSCSLWEVKP